MNILLFVTSMIMVMAMLTYARLETYRSFSLLQAEFKHYMDDTERGYINLAAENWYINSPGKTKSSSPNEPPKPPPKIKSPEAEDKSKKASSRSRLSFASFVDQKKKTAHEKEFPKLFLLAKKLIYVLYKDQPFFKEMEQKRADFVDGLLNALMVADNLPKDQKLKRASDLANLNLGDEELNAVFYKMLQKTVQRTKKKIQPLEDHTATEFIGQPQEDKGEDDDSERESGNRFEYNTPKGFYSLLDFITLQDATKIRVFLAKKQLLLAIFDDPAAVNAIIETRNDLYKKVKSKAMTPEQASEVFKNQFASVSDPNFDDSILDFKVTATNPKNYD